ncbi:MULTISPECIES: DUF4222 domain-containing protein [Morganella]|uniref:DUF4222 domain-containing protein n=1 Tax=Morganella TaxID=581 RepID=UPI0021CEF3EE|nr:MULTISPECIES: DUF4222 domain-containing protein [Morganella]MCU6377630.1 DUF4222 domain-containing protein [Morganella morganii]MDH0353594.1 DUF4222 domain-containing protein [Morganella sp. GD04133]
MHNLQPHSYYTHRSGEKVLVLSVQFNRVTFIRDGFGSAVTMPVSRFIKEYTCAGRASS